MTSPEEGNTSSESPKHVRLDTIDEDMVKIPVVDAI